MISIHATLQKRPDFQTSAMTLAQQFRQEGHLEGRKEGRQEGQQEGIWMGRIQTLAEIMGNDALPLPELEKLTLTELQERFQALQHKYNLRHKA